MSMSISKEQQAHNDNVVVSGYHSYFVFGRTQVQTSGLRLAIYTEVFRGFLQSLQVHSRIVP
jgi:hypothetical protein